MSERSRFAPSDRRAVVCAGDEKGASHCDLSPQPKARHGKARSAPTTARLTLEQHHFVTGLLRGERGEESSGTGSNDDRRAIHREWLRVPAPFRSLDYPVGFSI